MLRVCWIQLRARLACRDPATCAPLATWRHHTGPVPQLVLPPTPMEGSWADIILSVGDDGMVGLISLETMRVERCGYC